MVTKWLHLDDRMVDMWINSIHGAIHQWNATHNANANEDEKIFRKELFEISLHVSTRINMLPEICKRIRQGYDLLYNVIITHEPKHVFTKNIEGYALSIDHNKLYNLIIDIDSVLFEINSCCELIGKFLTMVYKHVDGSIINKDEIGRKLQRIIKDAGEDVSWYKSLDRSRNYFIHEGAPFLAVDISHRVNGKFDLLIMMENLKDFSDESKFIKLSELENIVQGFEKGKLVIREHILNLYKTKLLHNNDSKKSCFMSGSKYFNINSTDQKLINAAIDVIRRNYASPRHTVGAAVLCSSGKIYTGVNIECCGYGPCAEPVAIGAAISNGEREIVTIVAVTVDGDLYPVMSPCGNCRQLLFDYAPDCMVIITHEAKIVKIKARDLIPDAYNCLDNY